LPRLACGIYIIRINPGFPKQTVINELNLNSIELMETIQTSFDHLLRENLMCETRKDALRLNFDHKLKLEFHGTKITSHGGLLAYRELTMHSV
jgi:hypothetical protein